MKINTQVSLDKNDLVEAIKAYVSTIVNTSEDMVVTINQGRGANGTTADVVIGEEPKKPKATKIKEDVKKSSEGSLGAVLADEQEQVTPPEAEYTEEVAQEHVEAREPEEVTDTTSLFNRKG